MKFTSIAALTLALTSAIALTEEIVIDPNKPTAIPECLNPADTIGICSPCCKEKHAHNHKCLILNSTISYYGWANEFKTPSAAAGCTPCGAGSGTNGALPSLELTRFYHIRGNDVPFQSFGFATGLEHYDVSLRLLAGQDAIVCHSMEKADEDRSTRFDASRGLWAERTRRGPGFYGIQLYTLGGAPITTAANRSLAHTAILLNHDGSSTHFQIFWKTNGDGWARPVAFMDRHGNAIEVTYTDAHFNTVTSPVLDAAPYFKKHKIRDAYSREATFTYIQTSGRNVVSKITFPNGQEANYQYGSLGTIGNPMVKKVIHPDGAETTYSHADLNTSFLTVLTVKDVHADLGSRRKTLYFTKGYGINGSGQQVTAVRNRIRQASNGAGETTYASRIGTTTSDDRYVYSGGNMVKKVTYVQSNYGIQNAGYVANNLWNGDFHQGDTTTWNSELSLAARTNNSNRLEVATTDSRNRAVLFNRGPITSQITASFHPDSTADTSTRNAFNQPLVTTDRLGRITTRTYSTLGDLLTETTATGTADESTRTFVYNTRGQVIEERDALYDANFPELHNTRYEYDTSGFLTKKIEAADTAGGTRPETLFAYDTAGRLATATDPVGRTVTYDYDVQNRLVTTTYADTSTELVEYGTALEAALVKKTTDRNGYETTYQYDAADRRTQTVTAANTADPSTEICTYLTGTSLKQTCTTDGSKTEYLFDHRNRVIGTKVFPDANTTLTRTTELDELDRTRSTTDAYGRKTFYLYDHNDRLTRTVTETVPGALSAPAFVAGSSQSSANHNYTLTDKDGNTLQTNPSPNKATHLVTYTDPRDIFLQGLTRDLSPNAAYLIIDAIHDAEGQTLISTDARGIHTWMEYDKLGRNTLTITAVGTPDEIRSETDYDDNSNPTEVRKPRHFTETEDIGTGPQPLRAVETYTYNGRNLRKTHTTASGHPTLGANESWTYNPDGTANEHTDFRGNTLKQIWHTCCARLQATIDRDGSSVTIRNTDFKGQPIHTATIGKPSFQAAGYSWTNPTDADTVKETTTRFDGRGRPTHTTVWLNPLGDIGSCCGSGGHAPIAGLDGIPAANGLTTTFAYDDDLTDGIGLDATYATQLDALEIRGVTFGTTANGSAMAITNPAGETSVQVRDAAGRTVMSINPQGHIQTIRHDEVLPAAALTPPHLTAIPLPGALLTSVSTDALGHSSTTYSDGAGRTLLMEDAAGFLSGMAYDANSNLLISRDPNGLGQDCQFDNLNRDTECADLQEQSETTSRTKTYNAHNAVLTSTDAEGETTENTYDVRDRAETTTDANLLTTTYDYDANNNLLSLTDPKAATRSWTYEERNLRVTKVMPDANDTVSYTHDALGRLKVVTQQDASTIEMVYDLAGRVTSREYSDSTTDGFTYDAASRLLSATKGRHAITVNRTYEADGAMASESFVLDGRTYTLEREYDADNQVASQTFADGKVMTWTHNNLHLVTQAHYDGALVLGQDHDAGYRLIQQSFGNDLVRDITYDRLDNQRGADKVSNNFGPIAELDFGYEYLADKNIERESQTGGTFEDLSFTAAYDAGNRVTSYNRQAAYTGARETQTWDYDGAGNWESTVIDGTTQNRTHSSSDQLEVIAGDNLTYDPRGNQLTDNRGNEYEWDIDNRIVKSEGSGYTNIEYRYDALGRRIVRKQGTDKEVLLWWSNTEQSEHKHQAGQTTIQNDLQANPSENALNTIFARALEGSKFEIQYFHKNYLDHVMAVSADNGNLLEHYRYTAFGEPEVYAPNGTRLAATAIDNDILWNVRRYEPANGLYMYLYREYQAPTGRWPSRDPIEEEGGVNLYKFCNNDTMNWFDELGNKPKKQQNSDVKIRNKDNKKGRQNNKNEAKTKDIENRANEGEGEKLGDPGIPDWREIFEEDLSKILEDPTGAPIEVGQKYIWIALAEKQCKRKFEESGLKSGCACCGYSIKSYKMLIGGGDPMEYYGLVGDVHLEEMPASECKPPPPMPPGAPTIETKPGFGQYDVNYTNYATPY